MDIRRAIEYPIIHAYTCHFVRFGRKLKKKTIQARKLQLQLLDELLSRNGCSAFGRDHGLAGVRGQKELSDQQCRRRSPRALWKKRRENPLGGCGRCVERTRKKGVAQARLSHPICPCQFLPERKQPVCTPADGFLTYGVL